MSQTSIPLPLNQERGQAAERILNSLPDELEIGAQPAKTNCNPILLIMPQSEHL